MRPHRLSGTVFVLATTALVTLVGLLAALVTWAFHSSPRPVCTADCAPPRLGGQALTAASAELGEPDDYTSPALGFGVPFASPWRVESSSSDGVVFQTRFGELAIQGGRTTESPTQLIEARASGFQNQELPDLTLIGPIRGAHIGTQEGVGELYGGTFYPSSGSGTSQLVRIGIIVASRGGLTLIATAFVPFDQKLNVPLADDVDYAMTEFRWPGQ